MAHFAAGLSKMSSCDFRVQAEFMFFVADLDNDLVRACWCLHLVPLTATCCSGDGSRGSEAFHD